MLPISLFAAAVILLITGCSNSSPTEAPETASGNAVVNATPGLPQQDSDPFLEALDRQAQTAPTPLPILQSLQPSAAPQPVGPSALDTLRFDASNPEAMAASLRAFGNAATEEEQLLIKQAIAVSLMHTQQQIATEVAAGRQVPLDENSLFHRSFRQFHGKTFRQVYEQVAPIIPVMQQAYFEAQASSVPSPRR